MVTPNLVLFTLEFPYGKGEAFLENEIDTLTRHFLKVYIIPSNYSLDNERVKSLPTNAVVLNLPGDSLKGISLLKTLLSNLLDAVHVYLFELRSRDRRKYYRYYKSFFHYLAQDLGRKKYIEQIISDYNLRNAIFYDYWFVNATISLCLLRREGKIKRLICRAHGFDLYDERQFEGVVSFRNFKLKYLDEVFLISKHGYDYLAQRVEEHLKRKLQLSYLGIKVSQDYKVKAESKSNDLLFVSCSRLLDFKRVHMIPAVLDNLTTDVTVRWVHFGDGPCRDMLMRSLGEMQRDIVFEHEGEVANSEIHQFYINHYVDFFISLSTSEGLPVSMMEASAYGFPIIATIVNGVAEIVTPETGVPLGPGDSVEQMSASIDRGIRNIFDRGLIRRNSRKRFDAVVNYEAFVKKLLV